MKTCWVVMQVHNSPVAFCIPYPKAVFSGKDSKKKAQKYCDEHNSNPRTTTECYIRKAEKK